MSDNVVYSSWRCTTGAAAAASGTAANQREEKLIEDDRTKVLCFKVVLHFDQICDETVKENVLEGV